MADEERVAPRPQAPPGEAPAAVSDGAAAPYTQDHAASGMLRATFRADWEHPLWGIPLGLLLVVGDALLIPGEHGLTFGGKFVFCLAVAWVVAALLWAWRVPGRFFFAGGLVLAIVVAAGSGDWFGGATQAPAWRDAVVPAVDLGLLAAAAATWYAGRARGETLLVAAVTGAGMVVYGQPSAPAWVAVLGVAATLVFLAPSVRPFSRIVGMVMHALALLGLVQGQPAWFTWTAFPFLSLLPVYLLAVWARDPGTPRSVAWWTGVVVGGGTLLLGLSTLIGALRKDLPWGESAFMVGLGAGVLLVFFGLRWWTRRSH